jgi:hypothetical protein
MKGWGGTTTWAGRFDKLGRRGPRQQSRRWTFCHAEISSRAENFEKRGNGKDRSRKLAGGRPAKDPIGTGADVRLSMYVDRIKSTRQRLLKGPHDRHVCYPLNPSFSLHSFKKRRETGTSTRRGKFKHVHVNSALSRLCSLHHPMSKQGWHPMAACFSG